MTFFRAGAGLGILISLAGCGAGGCPDIYIPLYEVTVYDGISGNLLCKGAMGVRETGDCEIAYEFSETSNSADIIVSLEGYITFKNEGVENEAALHACFSQPEYTTQVEVWLEREVE